MSPEHHLLWMTASMGGMVQEEKQTRTWGEGGSRQQMLAGETQCLEEVRAGWRVAGLEGGPPGALWRQARVRPPGSSGWAWQGTWAEKVSLAECHHPGVLLHPRPTFPAILGLTALVAGWPSPGPHTSAPSCPLLLPVVKPWAVLPQHPLLIHSTSHSGAPRPHSRHWGYSSGQTCLGWQSFCSFTLHGSPLPSGRDKPPCTYSKPSTQAGALLSGLQHPPHPQPSSHPDRSLQCAWYPRS